MRFAVLLFMVFSLLSCNSDDDICTGGEGTPRMKIKFKTHATGKPKTLDSVFVSVDYGEGLTSIIERRIPTDSIFIPLRVDDQAFTDVYVSTTSQGIKSHLRVNYKSNTEYVSPACGIRKLYGNLHTDLLSLGPVITLENAQNEIVNENKTHLFLLF